MLECLSTLDVLHGATAYLAMRFAPSMPPDEAQANMDARLLLVESSFAVLNDLQMILQQQTEAQA